MYELDDQVTQESLRRIDMYLKNFRERFLYRKKENEKKASRLLSELTSRQNYSREAIEQVIDSADRHSKGGRWFGQVFSKPNVNLMFGPAQNIAKWFETLLDESKHLNFRIMSCLGPHKLKGARTGALTVFLYLSNPERYNVWTPKTHAGLQELVIDELPSINGKRYDTNYQIFNSLVIQLRDSFGLEPQEMDWVLWAVWTEKHRDSTSPYDSLRPFY